MKSVKVELTMLSLMTIAAGCGKSSDNTDTPTNIILSMNIEEVENSFSITCHIKVESSGVDNLTLVDKGVCYSITNSKPTIEDKVSIHSGNADFSSFVQNVTGLEKETVYYLRPFIRVENKTYYGTALSIKTLGTDASYYPIGKNEDITQYDGYSLIWSDEFNIDGKPGKEWSYESGFMRNEELQWYKPNNASIKGGYLLIEGKREKVVNPYFVAGSTDWKTNRNVAEYTSSSLTTEKSFFFKYGRMEVRAKLPATKGSWPAIWLLGNQWEWPLNGEIDVLEYYLQNNAPHIFANACWSSSEPWTPIWNKKSIPFSVFTKKDTNWADKYHVWKMDWDSEYIRIYLDDELLNEINLEETRNQGWKNNTENPFSNDIEEFGHYILLNLAIGSNGGIPTEESFPMKYKVDYVRVYQPN